MRLFRRAAEHGRVVQHNERFAYANGMARCRVTSPGLGPLASWSIREAILARSFDAILDRLHRLQVLNRYHGREPLPVPVRTILMPGIDGMLKDNDEGLKTRPARVPLKAVVRDGTRGRRV